MEKTPIVENKAEYPIAETVEQIDAPMVPQLDPAQMIQGLNGVARANWVYYRVRVSEVSRIMLLSARHARTGRGGFRYLQEPVSGYSELVLPNANEGPMETFNFIYGGNFGSFGTANVSDFFRMCSKSIDAFTRLLSTERASRLRSRIARADICGLLSGNEIPEAEQDSACQGALRGILSIGTKKNPLIFVLRGGERITRELHDLMRIFALESRNTPVSIIVFFDSVGIPTWHDLEQISRGKRE